ncbi:MAG TPA: TetR/AcrR family transcriptional regulator [Solirubrobacteraceae bacterium]|nr:TetR/AcrR family transcriptional regulator [Solirubrobacteraceae bacterium]
MPESPTTVPRPLRRDAQANRARILEAAGAVFAAHGIDAPLDEIARRAGVGAGTLYRHFADRETLLDALFDERVRIFDQLMTEAAAADDAWTGLVELLETGFALQAADRGLKDILLARSRGLGRVHQPPEETVRAITGLLDRAKAQGALRTDVTITDLPMISAAIHGVIDLTGAVAPDVWRRTLQIILDGLRADGAGPTPLPHEPLERDVVALAIEKHKTSRAAKLG